MAGKAFDFRNHPAFNRTPRSAAQEAVAFAAAQLRQRANDAAQQAERPSLYNADGTPIGMTRYCQQLSPQMRWDWKYLQLIDHHLDRVTSGEIDRLILCAPPRHGKSEKVTIRYPLYRLELDPTLRVIVGAYGKDLANEFSRKTRALARGRIDLSEERAAVNDWQTAHGGGLRAVGVGSGVTGFGGNLVLVDDPVRSREDADSPAWRKKVWNWFGDDLMTRLEPRAAVVIMMTHWHEDDLVGRVRASESAAEWTVIMLPALAEDDDPLGRALGEALNPERYDEKALARIRRGPGGERSFSALYQQRPAPAEGFIFKQDWFRYYTTREHPITDVPTLPPVFNSHLQSWDMAFVKSDGSDHVAGQVWSRLGADVYLRDRSTMKRDFVETVAAVRDMTAKWPQATLKLVENKANGPAVISTLRSQIPGLVAVEPDGDKIARAYAVTHLWEAGNVWLPHPAIAPWVTAFVLELKNFPNASHDDDVDAMTQALRRMQHQIETQPSGNGADDKPAKPSAAHAATKKTF